MIDTGLFGSHLVSRGYTFWSGVPCSYLAPLINWSLTNTTYIAAVNEGDAVATCAGAYLGGAKPVVLMQNSGLANAMSPLTSLTLPYQIPLIGIVSLRTDEPQHEVMGTITEKLLDLVSIRWEYLSNDTTEACKQIDRADKLFELGTTSFFVVKKGTFDHYGRPEIAHHEFHKARVSGKRHKEQWPLRREVLQALCTSRDAESVFLSTTGYTSRELYEVEDSERNFYMFGSLGCVSPCALGLSIVRASQKVVAIDGDGSLLMRLGALAVTGKYAPANMLHILLDNQVHESTGGQATVSGNTDFVHVAADCGYRRSVYAHSIDELVETFYRWIESPVLTFVQIKTATGTSKALSRPEVTPSEIATRCRSFIQKNGG